MEIIAKIAATEHLSILPYKLIIALKAPLGGKLPLRLKARSRTEKYHQPIYDVIV